MLPINMLIAVITIIVGVIKLSLMFVYVKIIENINKNIQMFVTICNNMRKKYPVFYKKIFTNQGILGSMYLLQNC